MYTRTIFVLTVAFSTLLACKKSKESNTPNIPTATNTIPSKWYRTDIANASNFCDIQMINKVLAYAADQMGQCWRTTDSGKNWIKTFTISPVETINSIHFISAAKGYAITKNRIYKTVDSGNSFQHLYFILDGYDIFFADEQTGYYSSKSAIYKTTDGGITWNFSKAAAYARLFFKNANNGWYNDENARLYYTANGGTLWTSLLSSSSSASNLYYYGLHAWDAQHVASGKLNGLKITQTGAGPFATITDTTYGGFATAVQFTGPNKGYLITNKAFVSKFNLPDTLVNGGIILSTNGLNEMSFIDSTAGMICANNGVILTFR